MKNSSLQSGLLISAEYDSSLAGRDNVCYSFSPRGLVHDALSISPCRYPSGLLYQTSSETPDQKFPKFAHNVTHAEQGFSTRDTNTSATLAQASERPLQPKHRLSTVSVVFNAFRTRLNISSRITTLLYLHGSEWSKHLIGPATSHLGFSIVL